jgi:hypothetical protein
MSVKVIGGAMVGVFVPIAIEYAAKGADISKEIPLKWSGVAGIVVGAVPIALVVAKIGPFRNMRDENKDAIIAFGAASLATGISILILEQLRKDKAYKFADWNYPLVPSQNYPTGLAQQYTAPVGQVIKEI